MEDETSPNRAEYIAGRAVARADRQAIGRLRSFAHQLEAGTRAALGERIAVRAVASGGRRPTGYILRRIGAIAAAAMTIAAGAVGVGAIANQASPGDLLYGVDRAYEAAGHALGARAPHTEERLAEALTLIDKGRSADAVALVDEAVKDYSTQHGLTDLEKAYAEARADRLAVATTTTAAPTPTTAPETPPTASVEDPVTALRLAVEMLLRDVRAADTQPETAAAVTDSALQAAAAASAIEEQVPVMAAGSTTTTTEGSSTTTESNTVTLPVDIAPDTTSTTPGADTTTLTMPDGSTTTAPGDITTTVPGDTTTTTTEGSTTTTTAPSSSSTTTTALGGGGIILPPQP